MARFKNKKGGVCEVYSLDNIEKLRKDKNYVEINEKQPQIKTKTSSTASINNPEKTDQESDK